jgi:hypothetical protein
MTKKAARKALQRKKGRVGKPTPLPSVKKARVKPRKQLQPVSQKIVKDVDSIDVALAKM